MKTLPRIKFSGNDCANQATRIFAENVYDLYAKLEQGQDAQYERGFFHTSTAVHKETCYYTDMWARDGGRGIIELCRMGFREEALLSVRFMIKHLGESEKWGRLIDTKRKYDEAKRDCMNNELDGNALCLLAVYNTWRICGRRPELAAEFLSGIARVICWIERGITHSPYGGLMPCISELSGNPNTDYSVYPIYPNYGMRAALTGLARMAACAGETMLEAKVLSLRQKLSEALSAFLISGNRPNSRRTAVPKGCFVNAIDGRDGSEYMFAEWGDTRWPIYHWTRQLPFIFDSDTGQDSFNDEDFAQANRQSYEYILSHMENSILFRKYGFVSNTGWTGTGGRHDDTMAGYGHGFMLQAALMADDINVYSKLTEGLVTLAYDGNITKPLAFDMNPWLIHECFNYENFLEGKDHTFGVRHEGRFGLMDNPGDEGNLVQQAECIKALLLFAGVYDGDPGHIRIMPRIPWDWDEIHVTDHPFIDSDGRLQRLEYTMRHDRWLRRTHISLKATTPVTFDFRAGPYPLYTGYTPAENTAVEISKGGSWIWVMGLNGSDLNVDIAL